MRRLITASVSAVMLHGAVFGVAEWSLAQTARQTPNSTREFAVMVRLNAAEHQPTTSHRQEQDTSDPVTHREDPLPEKPVTDVSREQHQETVSTSQVETLTERVNLGSGREATESEETPIEQQVTDVQDVASALFSDTTQRQQARGIPRGAMDNSRESDSTKPVPTITPERYIPPRYPEAARRRGLTGTVVVQATISRRGRVIDVEIVGSSGVGSLDSAAERAVRTWRFARGDEGRDSLHHIRFDLENTP